MGDLSQFAEEWAFEKIRSGEAADFNARFGELEPSKPDGWNIDRAIGPDFLQKFSEKPGEDEHPIEDIHIVGAFFPFGMVLPSGGISRDLFLIGCRSDGSIRLGSITFEGFLSLYKCCIGQTEDSPSLVLYSSDFKKGFSLRYTTCKGNVFANDAKVDGSFDVGGTTLGGAFFGEGLHVSGSLDLSGNATFKGDVCLRGARIEGALTVDGSTFEADLNGEDLHVSGDLSMSGNATFEGEVILRRAKIDGNVDMRGSTFRGAVSAFGLQVGWSLLISKKAIFNGDVSLIGARIGARADISNSTFKRSLICSNLEVGHQLTMTENATFEGDMDFGGARIGGQLLISGSTFEGELKCNDLQVGQQLSIGNNATFNGAVNLADAKIGGDLYLDEGATFKRVVSLFHTDIAGKIAAASNFGVGLSGIGLHVGQDLFMKGTATFYGDLVLAFAEIGGQVDIRGSTFGGDFIGIGLHVGQNLSMSQKATFKCDVLLNSAHIGGTVVLAGSTYAGQVSGLGLQVGADLIMGFSTQLDIRDSTLVGDFRSAVSHAGEGPLMGQDAIYKGDVQLSRASVAGSVFMAGSRFEGTVDGCGLHLGGDLVLGPGAVFMAPVTLLFASVGGYVQLPGATFANLDLTGATVTGDLRLVDNDDIAIWAKSDLPGPILRLRNTQVGALHDSPQAWPSATDLEGFFYKHLGSFGASTKDDPRNRSVEDWVRWLATDGGSNRGFSPQPYAQLADYFVAAGRREQANSILFAGRERERKEAFRDHRWRRWLWLSTLRWLCGYGIGVQTFWVLPWIIGSVIAGAGVLWFGAAENKSLWWCIGASLDRLLPIIQLNKGFDDFFDASKGHLTGGAIAFFSALRLWGWVLGSFLVAAVAGLLQKS